jgi:hypothetical protein
VMSRVATLCGVAIEVRRAVSPLQAIAILRLPRGAVVARPESLEACIGLGADADAVTNLDAPDGIGADAYGNTNNFVADRQRERSGALFVSGR